MWSLLRRTALPPAATETLVEPMRRMRGRTKTVVDEMDYFYCISHEEFYFQPDGPLISSRTPSGQAPIFDVDAPVQAKPLNGRRTRLTFNGYIRKERLRAIVKGMNPKSVTVTEGHVSASEARRVRDAATEALKAVRWRRKETMVLLQGFTITINHPARAVPSKTDGHFHLYVDSIINFNDSLRLAEALGWVDPRHIRISRASGCWYVRAPVNSEEATHG